MNRDSKKNKKIVFVINNYAIGGVERLLLSLLPSLKEHYNIYIITVLGEGPLLDQFKAYSDKIYRAGFSFSSRKNILAKLFFVLTAPITGIRLIRILLRVKPDILLSSLYQADILAGLSAWFLHIQKRIIIQHDMHPVRGMKKFLRTYCALKLSTNIIAVAEHTKIFLQSYWGIDPHKITVIPNTVDTKDWRRGYRNLDRENIRFGILGRLDPVKGHRFLLRVWVLLRDKYQQEPPLYIAGDGPERSFLEDYACRHQLKNLHFLGEVMDAPEFFKDIDIVINPSSREGFGLTVLESLMAKKIVLASDLPVFSEIIKHGENGIMFPMNDEEKLAEIINHYLNDPEDVALLSSQIHQWLRVHEKEFDIQESVTKYSNIFNA